LEQHLINKLRDSHEEFTSKIGWFLHNRLIDGELDKQDIIELVYMLEDLDGELEKEYDKGWKSCMEAHEDEIFR